MALANTPSRYGSVSKVFHWCIALAILTMIPLGILANVAPLDTGEALARKVMLFSVHKTLGVLVFFTALARIVWACVQSKPGHLHPEHRAENALAEMVHWALYALLVIVPFSGWVAHAAADGFAPIRWPFGQDLPLVPNNEGLVRRFASIHIVCQRMLIAAIALHIAGALKHHWIDRDVTLRRMLPGQSAIPDVSATERSFTPFLLALALCFSAVLFGATRPIEMRESTAELASLSEANSAWIVRSGTISISVTQLGNSTQGEFSEWTAAIEYDPEQMQGSVDVTIALASLTLGAVTDVALGRDFFGVTEYPTAHFGGPILNSPEGHYVDGVLAIRDREVPVKLPFELDIEGETARMLGSVRVNRHDFDVGPAYDDPEQVGFDVGVTVELSASRS